MVLIFWLLSSDAVCYISNSGHYPDRACRISIELAHETIVRLRKVIFGKAREGKAFQTIPTCRIFAEGRTLGLVNTTGMAATGAGFSQFSE